jgi:hypothetical protein
MANQLMTLEVTLRDPASGRRATERIDISMSALLGILGEDRVEPARDALVSSFKSMVDRCYLQVASGSEPAVPMT